MGRRMFVLGILLWACPQVWAQHHTNIADKKIVDGSKTPELIPDSVAYYHVFLALAPTIVETQPREQARMALLHKSELEPVIDAMQLTSVLTDFRTKFDQITSAYNALAQQGKGDQKLFYQQLDALVSETRETLGKTLSLDGTLKLDRFVQSEKRFMTIQTGRGAQ